MAAVGLLGKPGWIPGQPESSNSFAGFSGGCGASSCAPWAGGQQVDELEVAMNRAAEAAVPLAQELLSNAVKSMSVNDAKKHSGAAATPRSPTSLPRRPARRSAARFLPVVTRQRRRSGWRKSTTASPARRPAWASSSKEDAAIEPYVTRKSLDGLYAMIGEEEKKIRQDPAGSGSAILRKVFGAMQTKSAISDHLAASQRRRRSSEQSSSSRSTSSVCWPSSGGGSSVRTGVALSFIGLDTRRSVRLQRMLPAVHHAALVHLRVGEHLGQVVDRAAGHLGRLQRGQPVGLAARLHDLLPASAPARRGCARGPGSWRSADRRPARGGPPPRRTWRTGRRCPRPGSGGPCCRRLRGATSNTW